MSGLRTFVSIVLAAALAAPGCVTSTTTQNPRQRTVQVRGPSAPPRQPIAGTDPRRKTDPLNGDPCATRLHDIAGAMLLYYAIHRRLPDSLEGLRETADIDQELNFACPVTGQPYDYNPTGLEYQGRDERLIVYDSLPAHGGTRWGVLAAPPRGNHPAATWVVQLPEGVFRVYTAPSIIPEPPAEGQKPDVKPPPRDAPHE